MAIKQRIAKASILLGMIATVCACVVTTREGYYDRDHHRYWHEHSWVACTDRDEHCRE